MLNPPPQEVLNQLPRLYANEKTQTSISDIILHLHFFVAACDWWIAEYDGDDIFWGFVNLGDDLCAEWGYVSYDELKSVGQSGLSVPVTDATTGELIGRLPLFVEYDEYWQPKPFREIQWRKNISDNPDEQWPAHRSPEGEGGRKQP